MCPLFIKVLFHQCQKVKEEEKRDQLAAIKCILKPQKYSPWLCENGKKSQALSSCLVFPCIPNTN